MVRMGSVWDRTTEVLRGRAAILGSIAAVAIFLPAVINTAVAMTVTAGSVGVALIAMAIAFGVLLANLWGQLAMLAVSTDPATTRADAMRQASARVLPALGVLLGLAVIFGVGFFVLQLLLQAAGMQAPGRAMPMPTMEAMQAAMRDRTGLALLAFLVVALCLTARLLLLNAVILNERRGIGAIARSWRLTRGMTMRLVGLMLLFVVILLIPTLAAQSVVGLIFRLVLGEGGIAGATFAASIAGAAVTTVFTVVAAAFTAQLYVAAVADAPSGG